MSADSVAQDQLRAFVRRIESVDDELKALNSDKSEIYKEARGCGYDVKVLRKVIAARRQDATERQEQGALFDLYWDAIEGVEYRVVRAHVENIEQFDADGVLTQSQVAPQPASDLTTSRALSGQVAPIQPETANHTHERASTNDEASSEAGPKAEASLAGTGSEMLADREARIEGQGASVALPTLSFADRMKKLRPLCQHPTSCRSSGGKSHCWSCEKANEQQGAA